MRIYATQQQLTDALRAAANAHHAYEQTTGQPDANLARLVRALPTRSFRRT